MDPATAGGRLTCPVFYSVRCQWSVNRGPRNWARSVWNVGAPAVRARIFVVVIATAQEQRRVGRGKSSPPVVSRRACFRRLPHPCATAVSDPADLFPRRLRQWSGVRGARNLRVYVFMTTPVDIVLVACGRAARCVERVCIK